MSKSEYEKTAWYLKLTAEQKVVLETRLGMMCDDRDPTREQMKIAWKEAVGAV